MLYLSRFVVDDVEGSRKTKIAHLSQFWYDEATCEAFSKIILGELKRRNILKTGKIIFISSPTAFKHMMANKVLPQEQMHLLEFDKRFGAFSNFSFWDYNDPINLDSSLKAQFDLILMDPPFLNAGKCFTLYKIRFNTVLSSEPIPLGSIKIRLERHLKP